VSQLYMIDTNTVSYIINGKSPASRARLINLQPGEVACISVITEAEIQYGLAKNPNATVLRSALEGFFAKIQILPWGREEAQTYGGLRAKQEKAGKPLGNLDMLIAAHAISVRAILVTNDRAFSHLSGLTATAKWATEL
jgi:tRNA(fMet)-specific endonuclease VapC